jgi:hypothetical protein
MNPVTIASVRAHAVCQLFVYCNGKREGRLALPSSRRPADRTVQHRGNVVKDTAPVPLHDLAGDVLIEKP